MYQVLANFYFSPVVPGQVCKRIKYHENYTLKEYKNTMVINTSINIIYAACKLRM